MDDDNLEEWLRFFFSIFLALFLFFLDRII